MERRRHGHGHLDRELLHMADPLMALYKRMDEATTALEYLRAWSEYMLHVDPDSVEGTWGRKAADQLEAATDKGGILDEIPF